MSLALLSVNDLLDEGFSISGVPPKDRKDPRTLNKFRTAARRFVKKHGVDPTRGDCIPAHKYRAILNDFCDYLYRKGYASRIPEQPEPERAYVPSPYEDFRSLGPFPDLATLFDGDEPSLDVCLENHGIYRTFIDNQISSRKFDFLFHAFFNGPVPESAKSANGDRFLFNDLMFRRDVFQRAVVAQLIGEMEDTVFTEVDACGRLHLDTDAMKRSLEDPHAYDDNSKEYSTLIDIASALDARLGRIDNYLDFIPSTESQANLSQP